MASRKKFLPEGEIQELERLGSQEQTDSLSSLSHEALVKLFIRMLNSYRTAARVANASAKDIEAPTEETHSQLMRCLAEYMPNYFTRHAGDVEVLCDELTYILQECEGMEKAQEVRELIEDRLIAYEQTLQHTRAQAGDQLPLPPRTPVRK